MTKSKSPFSALHVDSDMDHRFEVVETAWNSDPEVKAALKLLKSKQNEFIKKAGIWNQSENDQEQFFDQYREWTEESDPTDVTVFTSVFYENF